MAQSARQKLGGKHHESQRAYPSRFLLSVILAVIALLVHYAGVSIPYVGKHVFEVLLIAYAAPFAGNILKGI